jgi:hypothetical protein
LWNRCGDVACGWRSQAAFLAIPSHRFALEAKKFRGHSAKSSRKNKIPGVRNPKP